MNTAYNTTAYRYPTEYFILGITLILVFAVMAITAAATLCLSLFFVGGVLLLSFASLRSMHQSLMQNGQPVNPQTAPELSRMARENAMRLQIPPVDIFIARNQTLNAYTFGLSSPKTIVLHSALFEVMDQDEIQFILGHEMGHVRLGHTVLNSLIGGLAGVPSSYEAALLLSLAFRGWNRACEYSADRAGLLACGRPDKAISALVKLEIGGNPHSRAAMERALQAIEASEGNLLEDLSEIAYTHPIIVHRIKELQEYAATREYARLQALVNQNVRPQ